MTRILVADNSVLVREGLKSLLRDIPVFSIEEVAEHAGLLNAIKKYKPQVLVIDPQSFEVNAEQITRLKKQFENLNILAITNMLPKSEISLFLNSGVTGYLLKDCDKEEICEALENTRNGNRFLCGKIVDVLMSEAEIKVTPVYTKKISCQGLAVSEREIEIIKHIALGLSNKQIADKLCLSLHTVNTHRKNIMQKLRVNNTA
ncbi:MAG TPA: response regulator transcription factor, partial [Bacteroidia bacterium]|nr:response regulator transcription factor [Bacteroidia bacterium]